MFSAYEKAVLSLFRAVPRTGTGQLLDSRENVKHGLWVTEAAARACPALAEEDAQKYLWDSFGYDMKAMNRGFYRNFHEVQEASDGKWLMDQILHYVSVGLQNGDMTRAEKIDSSIVYVPATELDLPEGEPLKLTVIDVMEQEEIVRRTESMALSGMALSQVTLQSIAVILKEAGSRLEIGQVPNKELRIYLYDTLGQVPDHAQEFLRFLLFKATGDTLLIKSQDVIGWIRACVEADDRTEVRYTPLFRAFVAKNGIGALAAEFLRYKKLWLSFKGESAELAHILNRARKLADRHKYVKKTGLLERLTWDETIRPEEAAEEIPKVTVYRRIALANCLLQRAAKPTTALYFIRNGKAYAKELEGERGLTENQRQILSLLLDSITAALRPKVQGRKFYLPPEAEYALPVSEKRFVGGIPFYSSLKLGRNAVLGVHWENLEHERVDLDFHYVSEKYHVGWTNQFNRKRDLIFSGDMTDAPKEKGGATEAFFLRDSLRSDWAAIMLNRYTDNESAVPYKLVMGAADPEQLSMNYLLNCHKMTVNISGVIEHGEDFLGFLHADEEGEKTFYFLSAGFGRRIVAGRSVEGDWAAEAVAGMAKSCLKLREMLERAGGMLVEKAEEAEVDLSLEKVTRETFVNLLEGEG